MTFNDSYIDYDKRSDEIYALVNNGMSRDAVAKKFNYSNIRSMDQLMRRRGYKIINNKYVKEDNHPSICTVSAKTERLMYKLNEAAKEKKELTETQLRNWGFENRQQLNDYLKEEGVKFDPINKIYYAVPKIRNNGTPASSQYSSSPYYNSSGTFQSADARLTSSQSSEFQPSASQSHISKTPELSSEPKNISDFFPFIQFLYDNKYIFDNIIREKSEGTPQTFNIPGKCVQKTFNLNCHLATLINNFADEHCLRHKQVIESAVVEYLEKYGYIKQVEGILHRE